MKYFILFLLSYNAYGMCNFPHNPSVYCVKGIVNNIKKYTKSSTFKCVGDLKIQNIVRPKKTYSYNKNLDLVNYNKSEKLSVTTFKQNKIYAKNCNELKATEYLVQLSCYDKYEEFPDTTFLSIGNLKQEVVDPWKQKSVMINCEGVHNG